MITEHDLQEAISECQGVRNPNANTCIKLAAFLILKRELYGEPEITTGYSADPPPDEKGVISFYNGSEFSSVVDGMEQEKVLSVLDEMMEVLEAVNPNLYRGTIQKLKEAGR